MRSDISEIMLTSPMQTGLLNIDLQPLLIGGVLGFVFSLFASIVFVKFSSFLFGLCHLRHLTGKYQVYRKAGELFSLIESAEVTWDWTSPRELIFRVNSTHETRAAKGKAHFTNKDFGQGYYKHEQNLYYGTFNAYLFENSDIGFQRTYTKEDPKKPEVVTNAQVIVTSLIMKKIQS